MSLPDSMSRTFHVFQSLPASQMPYASSLPSSLTVHRFAAACGGVGELLPVLEGGPILAAGLGGRRRGLGRGLRRGGGLLGLAGGQADERGEHEGGGTVHLENSYGEGSLSRLPF